MTEALDAAEIQRQLHAHAQRLAAAGIEWIAPSLAPNLPSAVAPAATATIQQPNLPDVKEPPARVAAELSLEQRRVALEHLAAEVSACMRCAALCSTRTQTVFGDGTPGVDLCFVGEAPGADEDRQGVPFVGEAGQLLNRIIAACGLRRDEVYIMNVLKCRPPGNRTPLPDEAANCRDYFERQMDLVKPKFICALGGSAAANLLQTTLPIGRLRGRFHDYRGIPVLVTYHPAFLLPHRSPQRKRDVWEDLKLLLQRMGRPIPERTKE